MKPHGKIYGETRKSIRRKNAQKVDRVPVSKMEKLDRLVSELVNGLFNEQRV